MRRTRKYVHSRKGLSDVVAVLILVTVSVLLATVVALYVSNITSTRMKSAVEENVRFYKTHAWVNESDTCVVSFKLYNLGGKSITIESVVIRGTEVDWPDVYWNRTKDIVFRDMNETRWSWINGTSYTLDNRKYVKATGNIFVKSGEMILVYLKTPSKIGDPSIIHRGNIGQPILLAVSTPNACHTIEILVESCSL